MYLTRWPSVSQRAGALLHLQGHLVTRGVGNGNVHLDIRDAARNTWKMKTKNVLFFLLRGLVNSDIPPYLLSARLSAYVALIMNTSTSASAINRCSRVHGCPSERRQADCLTRKTRNLAGKKTFLLVIGLYKVSYLSEENIYCLWYTWEELNLRVIFQEDVVSLENHIRHIVDALRALERLKADGVVKLPAVGGHLPATKTFNSTAE